MSKETMLFMKFGQKDERLKQWWTKLRNPASDGLRRALNFYLDYKKYKDTLELLIALKVTPEEAYGIIKGTSQQPSTPLRQPQKAPTERPSDRQPMQKSATPSRQPSKVHNLLAD